MRPSRFFFRISYCLLGLGASSNIAESKISDNLCSAIRSASEEYNTSWFGLDPNGRIALLTQHNTYPRNAIDKIVFLHRRSDLRNEGTVTAVKITYEAPGNIKDRGKMRLSNNFKRPFTVEFSVYQSFHKKKNENYSIKANFHLTKGAFSSSIPFTTYDDDYERNLMLFGEVAPDAEDTFRSYLFTMESVRSDGSCVDFSPFPPSKTSNISLEFVDLLPDKESGNFIEDSIEIELR